MSRQSQQYSSKNTWNAAIPASEVACRSRLPQERALGVKWCAVEDLPSLKPVRSEFSNTKRGVLSTTSSLFEALGLAAPYVIKAKLIIQEHRRRQIKWDEVLPNDIPQQWQVWKNGLKTLQPIAVPWWYSFHHHECQSVQLLLFCDASEIAYGAVAWFRTVTCGCVNMSFVIGKTRLNQDIDHTTFGAASCSCGR